MKDDDKFNQVQPLAPNENDAHGQEVEITPEPFKETKINADKAIDLDKEVQGGEEKLNFSSVAQSANTKKMAIIAISVFLVVVMYYLYNNVKETTAPKQTPTEKIQQRSQTKAEIVKESKPVVEQPQPQVAEAPKLEAPPPLQAPKAPTPPPAPAPEAPQAPVFPALGGGSTSAPGTPAPPVFQPGNAPAIDSPFKGKEEEEKHKKALEARRKASIMVLGGSARHESQDQDKDAAAKDKDKDSSKDKDKDKDSSKDKDKTANAKDKDKAGYLGFGEGQFGESDIPKTTFEQVKVTKLGRTDSVIAQGKIINAVLENAINTDLPGTLRAIVTRDVYAESGKNILVPKGSRVIGVYQSEVKAGQTRVAVVWNRLIRPDGIDLALDSNGTDTLGRSGIKGFLDNKFLTKLGNAMLISYVVPVVANRIFDVNKSSPTTTTSVQNAATGATSTTSTSTIGAQQAKESSDKFREIMTKTIEETFSTKPTIYVDQGSEINILVNKDLVFPQSSLNGNLQVVK